MRGARGYARRMRAARVWVSIVGLGAAVLACRRDEGPRPDPSVVTSTSRPSASASASSRVVAPPVPSSTAYAPPPPYECLDGELRTSFATSGLAPDAGASPFAPPGATDAGAPASSGFGGLGISGVGAGSGDRVDGSGPLGLGGLGGLPSASLEPRVTGRLLIPAGTAGLGAARVLCAMGPAMRLCARAASTPAKPAREKIAYAIEVRGDGAVIGSKLVAGALADAALGACLVRAIASYAFPAGTPSLAYEIEIGPGLPRGPRLRDATPTVTGALPPEVIRRIARSKFPALRACYEPLRLADEHAAGDVKTTFVIASDGSVSSAKSDAGTIVDRTMRACVQKVFAETEFPTPTSGTVTVVYSVAFSVE